MKSMKKRINLKTTLVLLGFFFMAANTIFLKNVSAELIETRPFFGNHLLAYSDPNDSGNSRGDVIGTSVVVASPVSILDIKSIETGEIIQDVNFEAKINLTNLSGEEEQLDEAVLIVKKLDGTEILTENVDFETFLSPGEETVLSLEFSNNLEEGKYIGVFELYSKDKLVGEKETILSVSPPTQAVLGSSIVNYEYLLFPALLIFAAFLILSVLIIVKRGKYIYKGIRLKIIDLVIFIMGFSVFGLGIFGGYFFSKTIFPYGILLKEEVKYLSNDNEIASEENGLSEEKTTEFVYDDGSLLLYEKPDDDSEVVNEIKGDLDMEIIDQAAGWYRIILKDGIHGWVRIKDINN